MGRDNEKPATGKKTPEVIQLNDLLPRQNVQGGQAKGRVVFGAVNQTGRKRRPGLGL